MNSFYSKSVGILVLLRQQDRRHIPQSLAKAMGRKEEIWHWPLSCSQIWSTTSCGGSNMGQIIERQCCFCLCSWFIQHQEKLLLNWRCCCAVHLSRMGKIFNTLHALHDRAVWVEACRQDSDIGWRFITSKASRSESSYVALPETWWLN